MHYNVNDLLLLIVSAMNIVLAVFLVRQDHKSPVNISFAAITICLALWASSFVFWSMSRDPQWTKLWINMTYFSISLIPAFFLYFATVFPNKQFIYSRGIFATFLPAFVFASASFTTLIAKDVSPAYIEPQHGQWYFLFIAYILAYLGYAFYIIMTKYFKASGNERYQMQYLIFGSLITAFIALLSNAFLASKGMTSIGPFMVIAIGPMSTIIMAGFITYSIFKHNLLGIEHMFSKLFSYIVLLSFLSVGMISLATNTVRNIIYFYTILAIISLGVFVFITSPKKKVNLTFLIFTFLIAAWTAAVLIFRVTGDLFWGKMIYALASFIPAGFISFVRVFPKEMGRKEEISHFAVYFFSIIFCILAMNGEIVNEVVINPTGAILIIGQYGPLIYIFFGASALLGFIELYFNYKNAKGISRMQVKYLYLGTLLALAGAIIAGILLPMIGFSEFAVMGPPCFLIMIAFLTYAILKHRLISVEAIIQRGLIYIIITGSILLIYFFSEYVLREVIDYSNIVATFFTAFIMAVSYKPVFSAMQSFTDSVFFKGKYDYQRILSDTGKKVSTILKLEELAKLVITTLVNAMRVNDISLLLLDKEREKFKSMNVNLGDLRAFYKKIETSDSSPIIRWLINKHRILVRDELEAEFEETGSAGKKEAEAIRQELDRLEFAMWVPIIFKSELVAVICLGYKTTGDMYTDEDIELLNMLASQLAIALENSMMYSTITKQYEELKLTKDRLVQADKLASLGNMAAGMAHEIKNPLSSMKVFSQLLSERYQDAEFRAKFLEVIPKEINRIDKIVEGLIAFSRSPEPNVEDIDLTKIIEEILDDFSEDIKRNKVTINKSFIVLPNIKADGEQIKRAFSNLILNAIQAMPDGGMLEIGLATITDPEKAVLIKISDTGVGIKKENMKHIFDPFYTTKHYGTGLGLAIAHSIIDSHNGTIEMDSIEGKGTTFYIALPLR